MAQTGTQCQENEALLEIHIAHEPIDISEYLDISIQGPRLPTTNANQTNRESYAFTQSLVENGTRVTDNKISLCVPDDQCLLVVAKLFSSFPVYYEGSRYQLPPDEVSIVYNGQVWSDKKGPFAYSLFGTMIVAELGACDIVCESDQALVEIEAVTGYTLDYDWQIIDDATGEMIQYCPAPFQNSASTCYWDSEQYYHERLCLPRDGCYTLLVAERSSYFFEFDAKSLHVYFDGNHVESFEYLQFINVALSDVSTVCDVTSCDTDSSLVELYFFRQDTDMEGNLTWSLSSLGSQIPGDLSMHTITSDDRAFQYHKECIPKVDSCILLSTSVTEGATGEDPFSLGNFDPTNLYGGGYQENVTFQFALDGIIYSSYYFGFGYSDEYVNATFAFTEYAGECSGSDICGNYSDFYVVQVDFMTEPAWQTAEVSFQLSSLTEDGSTSLTYSPAPFYPDQKYRFFTCIHESWLLLNNTDPQYCTEFSVSDLQFYDGNGSYNISFNGVPFTGQQTTGTGMYFNNYDQVTRLAGQCQGTLGSSSEARPPRVGLIFGCVLAALFACVGLAYCNLQTQGLQSSTSRPNPDTTNPDTTNAIAIPIEEQYHVEAGKSFTPTPQVFDCENTSPCSHSHDNAVHESNHEAQA